MAEPKFINEFIEFERQRDPEYVKKAQESIRKSMRIIEPPIASLEKLMMSL